MSDAQAKRWYAKVCGDVATGCWNWTGCVIPSGYGVLCIKIPGRPYRRHKYTYAHRLSYEMHVGPIPDGHEIDHLCRNRSCVNPTHLEAVTPKENRLRGQGLPARNARKTHCVSGHEYSPENTYRWAGGGRKCKICESERSRRRYAAGKVA